MIKKIAIALVVIIALILALAATRPDSFAVERRITIKAPPDTVMGLIGDFRNWKSWSPWEHLDPNMQRTFSGAANGQGAVYEWTGNSVVGRDVPSNSVVMGNPARVVEKDIVTGPWGIRLDKGNDTPVRH